MPGRRLTFRPTAFAILIAASLSGCDRCTDPPVLPEEQEARQIDVLPPVLHAAPGDEVVLAVRVLGYDKKVIVLPEWYLAGDPPTDSVASRHVATWSRAPGEPDDGLVSLEPLTPEASPARHRVLLTVAAEAPLGLERRFIVAVGGLSDTVAVRVREANSTGPGGQATPAPPGRAVPVLFVEEPSGTGQRWPLLAHSASLGPADLAPLEDPAGFELAASAGVGAATGSTGPPSAPPPLVRMPLRFWLTTSGIPRTTAGCDKVCELQAQIGEDLALANRIYSENRVGIEFYPWGSTERVPWGSDSIDVPAVSELPVAGFAKYFCYDLWRLLTGDDSPVPEFGKELEVPGLLHVVYNLEEVETLRGRACTYPDSTGFLMIYEKKRAPTTLAHELGHALTQSDHLGLFQGHPTSDDPGFDAGNLMWSGLSLRQATDRARLLAGQAVWMNVDSLAFLNLTLSDPASGPLRDPTLGFPIRSCGTDPDPCPSIDLRTEEAGRAP